jgi:hypothetical protein
MNETFHLERLGIKTTESMKNTRMEMLLKSLSVGGPGTIARELIEFLKGDTSIEPKVRMALAEALERGLAGDAGEERNELGYLMPRLVVTGMGRDGTVSQAIHLRRIWMDAAEDLNELRANGVRGQRAYDIVRERHGLNDDTIDKGNKLRNKFIRTIQNPNAACITEALNTLGDNFFDPANRNHFFCARDFFIDEEAEASVKLERE